jgi:glycosyltransferase involved in cell wall biosynthesis
MQPTVTRGAGLNGPAPLRRAAPIRVAFCVDGLNVGGTELNAVRTAERLDRERFDLSVVSLSPDGPLRARYEAAGIPVLPFPISSMYGASALREGMRLRRYLRGVDVVHSHDMYSNVFATFWARAAGTPVVLSSRRWEVFPRRVYALANRVAYRRSDCVIANSPWVAELVRTGEGVARTRVAVVPNFVDDAAFVAPRPEERARLLGELGVPRDALVVGVVANLTPIKDHATFLRAVARLAPEWPSLHAVLVGDGPCRPTLEAQARAAGIADRVHFAGLRPHVPNLHHLFDLSALTSTSEGFPNSLVEAMAAGRAVVATAVGGVVDAVEEGVTGLLAPAGDDARLAAAAGELLSQPVRRRAMGAEGRARAEARYSADAALGALEGLYESLLARRRAPAREG